MDARPARATRPRRKCRVCCARLGLGLLRGLHSASGVARRRRPAFDRDRLDHQRLVLVDEAEARLVRRLEGSRGAMSSDACEQGTAMRGVGAGVADMRRRMRGRHPAGARPARRVRPSHRLRAGRAARHDGLGGAAVPAARRAPLARRADRRQAPCHRPRAGRRTGGCSTVLHAERIGDEAGMLPAGAAEAVQRIARDVVAALDRDLLDRIGHVLDRDL